VRVAVKGDTSDLDAILCGFAEAFQNTMQAAEYPGGLGAITYQRDGSVTVADY